MKKYRLVIYIIAEILLLVMARLMYISTTAITNTTKGYGIYTELRGTLNALNILHAIVIFIPFLIVLGLIIQEVIFLAKEKQQSKEIDDITDIEKDTQHKDVENDEKKKQEEEKMLKEQANKKLEKINSCIRTAFSEKSVDNKAVSEKILGCVAQVYEITQGEIFLRESNENEDKLILSAAYAFYIPEEKVFEFQMGEGLIGQVAKAGEPLALDELPEGYITVKSGLGSATPRNLVIIPWTDSNDKVFGVIELASFKYFSKYDIDNLVKINEKVREYYE